MTKTDYTREELVHICEQAIVAEDHWLDRDSHRTQCGVGEAWALLNAGCPFRVLTGGEDGTVRTTRSTIWIELTAKGFNYFEWGDREHLSTTVYFLPTPAALDKANGRDWYGVTVLDDDESPVEQVEAIRAFQV